jgi:hypothetical protein
LRALKAPIHLQMKTEEYLDFDNHIQYFLVANFLR